MVGRPTKRTATPTAHVLAWSSPRRHGETPTERSIRSLRSTSRTVPDRRRSRSGHNACIEIFGTICFARKSRPQWSEEIRQWRRRHRQRFAVGEIWGNLGIRTDRGASHDQQFSSNSIRDDAVDAGHSVAAGSWLLQRRWRFSTWAPFRRHMEKAERHGEGGVSALQACRLNSGDLRTSRWLSALRVSD